MKEHAFASELSAEEVKRRLTHRTLPNTFMNAIIENRYICRWQRNGTFRLWFTSNNYGARAGVRLYFAGSIDERDGKTRIQGAFQVPDAKFPLAAAWLLMTVFYWSGSAGWSQRRMFFIVLTVWVLLLYGVFYLLQKMMQGSRSMKHNRQKVLEFIEQNLLK